ncbi:unannotated protein [freshwater metagenome]|uniref:Unannotated protein n=1 Tax=freshwater metagenome TaxID=449393 RepID=A0A6J6DVL9_9ZZZZ
MKEGSRGIAGGVHLLGVHLESPGQGGRTSEEFLVPPVAPTTHGLGQRKRRSHRPQRGSHRHPLPLDHPRSHDDSQQHPARDAEAAFPDLHDRDRVVGEPIPLGGHVIQPCSDHPRRHRPDGHGVGLLGPTHSDDGQAFAPQTHGQDDAQGDHQAVGPQLQGSDLQRPRPRTGDRRDDRIPHGVDPRHRDAHAVTLSANATAASKMSSLSKSCVAT